MIEKELMDRITSMYVYLDGLSMEKAGILLSQILYVTALQCDEGDASRFIDNVCSVAKNTLSITDWNFINDLKENKK